MSNSGSLPCPFGDGDIPYNQMGNEYNGHLLDHPELTFEEFANAATQGIQL